MLLLLLVCRYRHDAAIRTCLPHCRRAIRDIGVGPACAIIIQPSVQLVKGRGVAAAALKEACAGGMRRAGGAGGSGGARGASGWEVAPCSRSPRSQEWRLVKQQRWCSRGLSSCCDNNRGTSDGADVGGGQRTSEKEAVAAAVLGSRRLCRRPRLRTAAAAAGLARIAWAAAPVARRQRRRQRRWWRSCRRPRGCRRSGGVRACCGRPAVLMCATLGRQAAGSVRGARAAKADAGRRGANCSGPGTSAASRSTHQFRNRNTIARVAAAHACPCSAHRQLGWGGGVGRARRQLGILSSHPRPCPLHAARTPMEHRVPRGCSGSGLGSGGGGAGCRRRLATVPLQRAGFTVRCRSPARRLETLRGRHGGRAGGSACRCASCWKQRSLSLSAVAAALAAAAALGALAAMSCSWPRRKAGSMAGRGRGSPADACGEQEARMSGRACHVAAGGGRGAGGGGAGPGAGQGRRSGRGGWRQP